MTRHKRERNNENDQRKGAESNVTIVVGLVIWQVSAPMKEPIQILTPVFHPRLTIDGRVMRLTIDGRVMPLLLVMAQWIRQSQYHSKSHRLTHHFILIPYPPQIHHHQRQLLPHQMTSTQLPMERIPLSPMLSVPKRKTKNYPPDK